MHRCWAWVAVAMIVAPGCSSSTHKIVGGQARVQLQVEESKLGEALVPLVEDTPKAKAELDSLKTDSAFATALTVAASVFSLGSLSLTVVGVTRFRDQRWKFVLAALSSTALGSLLRLLGVLLRPQKTDYAKVLQLYNRSHPEHPYIAPTIGPALAGTSSTSSVAKRAP